MTKNMAKNVVISALVASALLAPAFASARMLAHKSWVPPQAVNDSIGG